MKQVFLPEDLESPNDKFFTHPVVEWLLNNAGSTLNIDWKSLGKSKESGLYQKLLEITNMIISKGGRGYFWVVCHPETVDLVSTLPSFVTAYNEQFPLGYPIVMHIGTLGKRWRIYSDPLVDKNTLLMGPGFSKKHVNFYCKTLLENRV